ncbi:hypothetical protein CL634_03405 [bacterium]|nr:hypothetical protein [bacterium]|tara:strand:+ start:61 stop:618 length:558 start_codon:yes stop_codon:yes gene_type:complete
MKNKVKILTVIALGALTVTALVGTASANGIAGELFGRRAHGEKPPHALGLTEEQRSDLKEMTKEERKEFFAERKAEFPGERSHRRHGKAWRGKHIDKAGMFSERASEKLTELENDGHDITDLQAKLDEYNVHIASAQASIEEAKAAWEAEDKELAREHMAAAKVEFKAAHELARMIIQGIKELSS